MILLAYALPGLLTLAVMLVPLRMVRRGQFLNWLTVAHAATDLVMTAFALSRIQLPQFFLRGRYLFIDSLGAYEALIASGIFLSAAFYARGYLRSLLRANEITRESLNLFYIVLNALLLVVIFAFMANNLALFWILVELTTILSAVLIVTLNAKENILAALKYVFIASSAMLFSLLGLLLVFAMTRQALGVGTLNWTELMSQAKVLPAPLFTVAFVLMFVGFAAKAGVAPFHTWLPPAHAKAPSVVSAILSAVLLNAGVYGILRLYAIAHQTNVLKAVTLTLIVFGIITVGVAAFSMLPRENIKKLIAFSSIEHVGVMIIGIGIGTPVALFGVLFYILGHSLIKSLLFFSAGILYRQFESNKYYDMKNVFTLQPLAATGVVIGGVAIIGTPMFPLFVAKIDVLTGLAAYSPPLLLLVLLLILIVAAAFALFLVRTCCRVTETTSKPDRQYQAPITMKLPIITLLVTIVALGVFIPSWLTRLLNGIVTGLGF